MKKLFLALALCAFVAAPAMADDHAGHASDAAAGHTEEAHHAAKDAAASAATAKKAAKKKMKKTAKKVTETVTEEAPAEATHN